MILSPPSSGRRGLEVGFVRPPPGVFPLGARHELGALGAAHAAGVVHRDVKPGNVLLAEDGQAKIGDFGIAKSLEALDDHTRADLTGTNQLVGTPAYLAPERIDSGPATPRSDLYSLGVTLYEALSGEPLTKALPCSKTMSSASASSMCAATRRTFALIFCRLL